MKKYRIFFLSIILTTNSSFASPKLMDQIYAVVNHNVILQSEVDFLMKLIKFTANKESNEFLKDKVALSRQALEHLIMDQIIFQIGQKMGFTISRNQVYQAMTNIAKQHNMTLNQIKRHLSYEEIDYFTYLDHLRKEIIVSEIFHNRVSRYIVIFPQEVKTIMQQIEEKNNEDIEINLSHILISIPESPTINQLKKAKNQACFIFKRALNGEDFRKLAIIYSSDYQLLKNNQTWWHIQEFPALFVKALKKAKKNDIIGPIQFNNGFYILKINDLHPQDKKFLITEFHVRHILLKTSSSLKNKQIKKELNKIADDIRNGKISFNNSAKKFSQDLETAKNGGDLGWISMIEMNNSPIYKIIKNLRRKQISEPIHSDLGWHLIQLLDTRCVDKTDMIKKDQAYRILFNQKFSEEAEIWLKKERANAYVKVLINL